jgi:hypothetical protein
VPFPAVTFCLMCESIRQEMANKLSILGFFGVLPDVDIGAVRLDQPLVLAVVLGFGSVTDAAVYNYSISVVNPDGSAFFQSPNARVNTVVGRAGILVTGGGAVPRVAGPRTVRLIINGEPHYENRFMIHQATTQELAGLPGAPIH